MLPYQISPHQLNSTEGLVTNSFIRKINSEQFLSFYTEEIFSIFIFLYLGCIWSVRFLSSLESLFALTFECNVLLRAAL
jgi:hypothetical protein